MELINNRIAFLMLISHAASKGRDKRLFGDSYDRVKSTVPDFLGTGPFPDIYLEFPLSGDPFLDITVLYDKPPKETHISLPLGEYTERASAYLDEKMKRFRDVGFGFEIDHKSPDAGAVAVGLQPKYHTEMVGEFCDAIGEPLYGKLFEEMERRLADECKPSYLGLFRGRPGAPLRVGGYLGQKEIRACMEDPCRLEAIFKAAGFTAYDEEMIGQILSVFAVSPEYVEFQFDIFPDGTLSPVFSVTSSCAIGKRSAVLSSFKKGDGARYMELLTGWGIADERWKAAVDLTFGGMIPLGEERLTFSVFPQWFKVSWNDRKLKPAKAYLLMKAAERGGRFTVDPLEQVADYWDHSSKTYDEGHDTENIDRWRAELSKLLGETGNKKAFGAAEKAGGESAAGKIPDAAEIASGAGEKVLDVGTGTGFLALMTAELGFESYGIDVAEEMMKLGREKAKERGLTVHFVTGRGEKLPWEDNTFYAVVNARLLWTLMDPDAALKEWLRVLKPGGKMIAFMQYHDPARDRGKDDAGGQGSCGAEAEVCGRASCGAGAESGTLGGQDYYGHDFEPVLPLRKVKPEIYGRALDKAGYRNVRVFYMPDDLSRDKKCHWLCIYGEK